jgi:hypothetical protein
MTFQKYLEATSLAASSLDSILPLALALRLAVLCLAAWPDRDWRVSHVLKVKEGNVVCASGARKESCDGLPQPDPRV